MNTYTPEQLLFLANSPEFADFIQHDPVLDEIEASRIDYDRERLLLFEAVRGTEIICGDVPVRPVTPFILAFLWTIQSPFVNGGSITAKDCAVFVYLLTHSPQDVDYSTIETEALEYARTVNLLERVEQFAAELRELVKNAFAPLDMLPKTNGAKEPPIFDSDWLLSVCSIAGQEANISALRVATELPLSAVYGYMVIRARKAHPDQVYSKHMPDWCSRNYMVRMDQLKTEFLEKHFKKDGE